MGVGTNILGYCNPYIEKKVIEVVKNGTMSTLNSNEEILLAEKLISLHPLKWQDLLDLGRGKLSSNKNC